MKGRLKMNRIEMFLELRKDNTKVFENRNGRLYYINQVGDLVYYNGRYEINVTSINLNSLMDYTEVKKPFRERIKEGEEYFYIEDNGNVDNDRFENCSFEVERIKFGNCFETFKEAQEARERIRKALINV